MNEKRISTFILAGIVASLVIAMFISPFASSFPDGLEKVAENLGFIEKAQDVVNKNYFVIPDYTFSIVGGEFWQTALSGLFGVLIMLAIFGLVYLIYKAATKSKLK